MRTYHFAALVLSVASCSDPSEGAGNGDTDGTSSSDTSATATTSTTSTGMTTSTGTTGSTTGTTDTTATTDATDSTSATSSDTGTTGVDESSSGESSATSSGDSSDGGSSTGCGDPNCALDCNGEPGGDATLDDCDVCDNDPANDCVLSFQTDGAWDCAIPESCQDVYEITFFAGSTVTISVSNVTGASAVRTAVFAPGVALDGINLLTGAALDYMCLPFDQDVDVGFDAARTGVYQVAIGRDFGQSAGVSGTYSLDIGAVPGLVPGAQTVDDVDSQAMGPTCP